MFGESIVSWWWRGLIPVLGIEPEPDAGPILVSTTYTVFPENKELFLTQMRRLRLSRLRTGAIRWELYQDGAEPTRFVEEYAVPSWRSICDNIMAG